MSHNTTLRSRGLIATILVIAFVLVGTFMFQLGRMTAGSGNSSSSSSNTSASSGQNTTEFEQGKQSTSTEMKRIGILQYVSHPALDQIHKGIVDELKKEGYIDGKNIQIFDQNGQADQSKLSTMSQQLVDKKSDVLVGIATPAAQALANTTGDVPIVMSAVTDPISAGLVDSMDKPGKNITGVSDQPPVSKQIDLAAQLLPDAKTVGMLYSSTEVNSKSQVAEATKEAEKLGLSVKKFPVPSSNEIAQTVQVMSDQVDFIYIPLDNTIANAMPTVVQEANKTKKPVITAVDTMVEQGGLATISVNQYQLGVQTGKMAAKLLKGESQASTTPVYTFTDGDVVLNTSQAKLLGVDIPDDVRKGATIVGGSDE